MISELIRREHFEYIEAIEKELKMLGVTKENIGEYTFVTGTPSKEIQALAVAVFTRPGSNDIVMGRKWLLKVSDLERHVISEMPSEGGERDV